jgi:hypothetical protein
LLSALLSGCATVTAYQPDADKNLPMKLGRIQRLEQDGVTVQVSITTDDEASRYFGVPLSEYCIQPIWMHIENTSDVDFWLMPIAVDPDYYSADEAARVTGEKLPKDTGAPIRDCSAPTPCRSSWRATSMPPTSAADGSSMCACQDICRPCVCVSRSCFPPRASIMSTRSCVSGMHM